MGDREAQQSTWLSRAARPDMRVKSTLHIAAGIMVAYITYDRYQNRSSLRPRQNALGVTPLRAHAAFSSAPHRCRHGYPDHPMYHSILYHIISYYIVSYHIISYYIISFLPCGHLVIQGRRLLRHGRGEGCAPVSARTGAPRWVGAVPWHLQSSTSNVSKHWSTPKAKLGKRASTCRDAQ